MGNKANLVITEKNGVCSIKVSGRANFEASRCAVFPKILAIISKKL